MNEGSRLFDETFIARARLRKWAVVAVGILVLLRIVAEVTPAMRRPDLAVLDIWQAIRGTERASPQVVIVGVDEKSIQRLGPMAWPRSEYVPLIERLSKAGARVIGFDFTFGTLEREAENNALLAKAMEEAGNVVFGYEFTDVGDPSPPGAPPSDPVGATGLSSFESPAILPAPKLIEPEPALATAAAAVGHIRTAASEDGRIRVLPLFIKHGDKAYPSLALQVARVYTGTPMDEIALQNGSVRMGDWDIPVSASAEVLLSWPANGENAFSTYSFLDVVRGDIPDEHFRGKAVLVAGTASGLDDRDFPFAVEAPGVLLYAAFLDNAFRFDFVQVPDWTWVVEWLLFLAVCGLSVLLLPRLSTPVLLVGVPLLAILVFGTSAFLFVEKGIWLRVVYPVVGLVVPFGLVVSLKLTASERETRDIAAEKAENQKLLALSFQEKGMLDMALATFAKLPFGQEMKDVYLNLGLDYENRGQFDKAYLVYKKVFDEDPGFEDVAARMERLSQQGARPSLFPATGHIVPTSMPASGPPQQGPSPTQVPVPPPTEVSISVEPTEFPDTSSDSGDAVTMRSVADAPMPTASGGPIVPGARFGRYLIEQHLGRGGMGDVYLVRDTVLDRKAALKTIRPDASLGSKQVIEARQRFYREAQTTSKLTHPNIVTVYDTGEELGMSYIVMEFVEGQTLNQWMRKSNMGLAQIKHVIYNAGIGLGYAHQNGIFHRDVKPDNIMITNTGIVKIMDFGIARIVESNLTRTGSIMGTPQYMSPEQVAGEKIDGRSDIFSLGVTLYELLTDAKPFAGSTMTALMLTIMRDEARPPSEINPKLSPVWDAVIAKALAKDPKDRYATAKEFAQAVRDENAG